MSSSSPETSGLAAAALPCASCGYDLRALPPDGPCPECGSPIARTLAGDRLIYCDPSWLSRLARGQVLLANGSRVAIIVVFLGIASQTASGWLRQGLVLLGLSETAAAAWLPEILNWAVLGGLLVALLLAGAGALLITEQEPREIEREKAWSTRALVRWGLAITIGALVARTAALSVLTGTQQVAAGIGLMIIVGVAISTATVSLLRYLARLAGRVPSEKLQKQTTDTVKVVRWALPALIIFPQLFRLQSLGINLTGFIADVISIIFRGLLSCALLVAGVMLLFQALRVIGLLGEYRLLFTACAEEAGKLFPGDGERESS